MQSQREDFFWKPSRPPHLRYEKIQITGDKNQNRKSLQSAAKKLHEIRLREDETSGILFELTNEVSYGSFVEILSMLHLMQWKCYLTDNRQIWVFFCLSRFEKEKGAFSAPTLESVSKQLPDHDKFKTVWAVIGENISRGWIKKWPALILFAILASLARWYSCRMTLQFAKTYAQTSRHSIYKDAEK
ncbi:MAG: hypothetical protein J7527_06425 [Chitinophagaceae bacterium]|nr:hypothetical protein [Chitinophagaceae bacterium]